MGVCGGGKLFFVFFVYYIYCTTLLIYGMVKRKKEKLLHDQTVYIYMYYVDMNMMYVNCQLGNNEMKNYKKKIIFQFIILEIYLRQIFT